MRSRPLLLPALALALGCVMAAQPSPLSWPRTGEGSWTYAWQPGWMNLPDGVETGNTHGCVALDSAGRVYLNTDSARAVMVFAADGTFLRAFGKDLARGLHGMEITGEGTDERLWLTHTGRHEVLQATLEGEILWRLPWPEESGLYGSAGEYKPTSVAVAPDGRFWVADGYGKGWVHAYSPDRKWLQAFGGPGKEPGKFRTPHGITWDEEIGRLVVADRENWRLQIFTPEGELDRVVDSPLRRPCHVDAGPHGWAVAELAGRVSLLDREGNALARLGNQPDPSFRAKNGIPQEKWQDGEFLSPHCAAWGPGGDVWVVDWNAKGRLTRLVRQPSVSVRLR